MMMMMMRKFFINQNKRKFCRIIYNLNRNIKIFKLISYLKMFYCRRLEYLFLNINFG